MSTSAVNQWRPVHRQPLVVIAPPADSTSVDSRDRILKAGHLTIEICADTLFSPIDYDNPDEGTFLRANHYMADLSRIDNAGDLRRVSIFLHHQSPKRIESKPKLNELRSLSCSGGQMFKLKGDFTYLHWTGQ